MMWEIWVSIALVVFISFLLLMIRRAERRKLKSRTGDLLSDALREEIEKERSEGAEKKRKFEEAMKSVEIGSEKATMDPQQNAIKPD